MNSVEGNLDTAEQLLTEALEKMQKLGMTLAYCRN